MADSASPSSSAFGWLIEVNHEVSLIGVLSKAWRNLVKAADLSSLGASACRQIWELRSPFCGSGIILGVHQLFLGHSYHTLMHKPA